MLEEIGPSPAELRQILHAEVLLADLDVYEDLAVDAEQETCPVMREYFRKTYRDIMGIDPSKRTELREGLMGISTTGRYPVADLLADLGGSATGTASRAGGSSFGSERRRHR